MSLILTARIRKRERKRTSRVFKSFQSDAAILATGTVAYLLPVGRTSGLNS